MQAINWAKRSSSYFMSFISLSGDVPENLLSEQEYERFNPLLFGQQHSGHSAICSGCSPDFPDVLCMEVSIRPREVAKLCTFVQHPYPPPARLSLCDNLPLYHVEHGAEAMELSDRVTGTYRHAPDFGHFDWRVAGYQDSHSKIFQAYGSPAGTDPGERLIHLYISTSRPGVTIFVT